MVATSTPSINWLLAKLKTLYPDIQFRLGDEFAWHPTEQAVSYSPKGDPSILMHEVGHALLDHTDYQRDIELIAMERAAWTKAQAIASQLELTIDSSTIEAHIDTYRDWLHARSLCPTCSQNGLQTSTRNYRCLSCQSAWQVNEARLCRLKRQLVPPTK